MNHRFCNLARAARLGRALSAVVLASAALLSAPAHVGAQSSVSEQVWVLPTGGTDVLWSYQVQASPSGAQITRRGDVEVRLQDGSLASYTAALKMPGGHLLLGDGSGRGAVRFDARGDEVDALASPNQWVASPGLAVASYLDENTPGEVFMGDNSVGRAHIYDTVEGRYIWSTSLSISGAAARIVATAVLPEERLAVAVNWPAAELSGVLIYQRDDRNEPLVALLSAPHTDWSEPSVVPELSTLRDMMALPSGELLVASASELLRLSSAGEILWSAQISEAGVGGEFLALSWLSERFAIVSTHQPGLWTSPHPNHRLLVYDTEGSSAPLTQSTPMDGAPLALELASGHGGTRTLGFEAPQGDATLSDLSALVVYQELTLAQPEVAPGAPLGLTLGVRNEAEGPTWVRAFELRAAPDACPAPEARSAEQWQEEMRLWMVMEATLQPQQELVLDGDANTAPLFIGAWCAQVLAVDRFGVARILGTSRPFAITGGAGAADIVVESLDRFGPGPSTPGSDAPLTPDGSSAGGCSAAGASSPGALGFALIALIAMFVATRRTRRA